MSWKNYEKSKKNFILLHKFPIYRFDKEYSSIGFNAQQFGPHMHFKVILFALFNNHYLKIKKKYRLRDFSRITNF